MQNNQFTVLINASNLYVGGGIQVALSFLDELKTLDQPYTYHILVSPVIASQIQPDDYPSNFIFIPIAKSTASLQTRWQVIKLLNQIEKNIMPNIVFTIFGPSYWRPKAKHLIGFADGWVYNPDTVAYGRLSRLASIKRKLLSLYKAYHLKRDGDYFVVETIDAKEKLSLVTKIPERLIFVVGNTFSNIFVKTEYLNQNNGHYRLLPPKEEDEFRLIYIAHNHPAKNLSIIPDLLPLLKVHNIKFVLTLDEDSYAKIFNKNLSSKQIINIGPVPLKSCPSLYSQCDALFAPTLLETFSAAYPEAMIMNLPILTSEFSFAKEICGDSAVYFNPLDPMDIANKIVTLKNDFNAQRSLIEKGKKRIHFFETAKTRAEKYLALCNKLSLAHEEGPICSETKLF